MRRTAFAALRWVGGYVIVAALWAVLLRSEIRQHRQHTRENRR